MWISPDTDFGTFELDEVYWYLRWKERTKTRENTYIMTMISREPRQIIGFAVDSSIKSRTLQSMVDSVPAAERYCTDGCPVYLDVIFGGKHIRNIDNKKDTHNIESTNADLRDYISGLARCSRCFYRKTETLVAVLAVFINAYNKFGHAKLKYRVPVIHKSPFPNKHLHKYRDTPFCLLDFL